jgi:twitching motility protein PilT
MKFTELLTALQDRDGSDLHIKAGLKPAIRMNGSLTPLEGFDCLSPDNIKFLVYDILTEEQIRRFEDDQHSRFELDFAYSINGVGRFRFNVHKQRGTIGVVVRSLATEIPDFNKLKLPESVLKMTDAPKGLALVTGPTGSGKSTTLAAIIDRINSTRADHILTIEDPIEYVHNAKKSYVTQREVGECADTLSFKNALKTALRQDPDVILIGEMRDFETIGIAITSAETGHLVFGTLHTNSAAQTIGRIIDVFPPEQSEQVKTQLAGNIQSILAQILLPTKDGNGRVCVCEIMFGNAAIRNSIRTNNIDAIYQSIQTGSKEGMQTMDQSLIQMVKNGKVSFETAKPHLKDATSLRQLGELAQEASPSTPAQHSSNTSNARQGQNPQGTPNLKGRSNVVIPPWEQSA